MCVGLLLSLTERFVYGSDAFFFLKTFASPTLHMSTNFCSWCKCDRLHLPSLVVSFALPVCEMCCPFCTCIYIIGAHAIFIFKTFNFLEGILSMDTILQCPHDEGRLLLSIASSAVYFTIQVMQRCKRRCSTSSRLSFSFGSLQNSDVHERDLESCLQDRRRESLRQDVKLHDESASPPASESRRSRILQPWKAAGLCRCVGRGRIARTSQLALPSCPSHRFLPTANTASARKKCQRGRSL